MKSTLLLIFFLSAFVSLAQNSSLQPRHRHFATTNTYSCYTTFQGKQLPASANQTTALKFSRTVENLQSVKATHSYAEDSLYYWVLNTLTNEWVLDYKYVAAETDAHWNIILDYGKRWDGSAWLNDEMTTYTYDGFNNPLTYIWQNWQGTGWENHQKGLYTYDANNLMLTEQIQEWDGTKWENIFLITYTYNQSGLQTIYKHQYWNGSNWENLWQTINTYDANGNLTNALHQDWNTDHWKNGEENKFVYDNNNVLLSSHTQLNNGAEIVNTETSYTYNPENKLIEENIHTWGNSWTENYKSVYTYSGNNLINILLQNKNGEIFENMHQTLYTYDGSAKPGSILRQDWKENAWVNLDLERKKYDASDSLTNYSYRYWNSTGTSILEGDSSAYYYHEIISGIPGSAQSIEKINIYPNPASSEINVTATGHIKKVEIRDMQGRLVIPSSIYGRTLQTKIDISPYPKGTYLVTITTSQGRESRKLQIR